MKGGMTNGELAVFQMDGAGAVTGLKAGSYVLERT